MNVDMWHGFIQQNAYENQFIFSVEHDFDHFQVELCHFVNAYSRFWLQTAFTEMKDFSTRCTPNDNIPHAAPFKLLSGEFIHMVLRQTPRKMPCSSIE